MSARLVVLGILVAVLGFVGFSSFYTVQETEQALVLQFGEAVRTVQEPGLHLKLPLVQQVAYYENRVLSVDPPVEQVLLSDQRRLDVTSFIRYRIVDPLRFYQTLQNEAGAVAQLSRATNSALRNVLGNVTQLELMSDTRAAIMVQIRELVEQELIQFGVQIVDVRLIRVDQPEATVQSVFDRMRSEREREAAEFRAQGQEQAQQIRSVAERDRTVILAVAEQTAQVARGEGDAQAIQIQADAFSQAPEFFEFYRSLEAYRRSLGSTGTTMVLSPESEFFRYFSDLTGGTGAPPPAPETIQPLVLPPELLRILNLEPVADLTVPMPDILPPDALPPDMPPPGVLTPDMAPPGADGGVPPVDPLPPDMLAPQTAPPAPDAAPPVDPLPPTDEPVAPPEAVVPIDPAPPAADPAADAPPAEPLPDPLDPLPEPARPGPPEVPADPG